MSRFLFVLYQLIMAWAAAIAIPYMLLRRSREVAERLGAGEPPAAGAVWVHAASLGEFEAAVPVLDALQGAHPPSPIVVSCTNWIARTRLRERLPREIGVRLAPIDLTALISPLIARSRVRSFVFIETEIWPAWFAAAARAAVPIAVVSARISDRSFRTYRRLRPLLAPYLGSLRIVGCRTEEDRRRWVEIGAPEERCAVWGNTKYAAGPSPDPRTARGRDEALVWTLGSIRRGEEDVLDSVRSLDVGPLRAILAPRHMRELDHWEAQSARRGLRVRRLSEMGIDASSPPAILLSGLRAAASDRIDLILVDRLGILRRLYWAADVSFVGGTLIPIGGHNLFEPAREGSPVFFGPSIDGVRDAAEALLASGGGTMVRSAAELTTSVQSLCREPDRLLDAGRRARSAAESLAGGAERTIRGLRALNIIGGGAA